MALPNLQASSLNHSRSPNCLNALQALQDIYFTAFNLLSTGNLDGQRAQFHLSAITENAIPLLLALESVAVEEEIPDPWIRESTQMFGTLIAQLYEVEQSSAGRETSNIQIPKPITVKPSRRGRPRKEVSAAFLRNAMDPHRNIGTSTLARKLGIGRDTLRREIRRHGISTEFSAIPDVQLDKIVKSFRQANPESGEGYVIGHLRSQGIRIQRSRIRASVSRVDHLGPVLRQQAKKKTRRTRYNVTRPNALWHIDGHHKLIMWGIVIHGCIDGFSRTITGLRASNNNRASTVLEVFLDAILAYGIPSRVRGDRGGENRDVSILMILIRGLHRASFMWGSSTHNSRIERLWVEVGTQFARRWRAFFLRLERQHHLDRYNPQHLWLLHYLFLQLINDDCEAFRQNWNSHPISGEGHYQSPDDMRLLGQLEHGVYVDDCDKLSVEEIEENYGAYGQQITRLPGQEGAGHPMDEDDSSISPIVDDEIDDEWMDDAEDETTPNIRHEPVPVPDHANPFSSAEMAAFSTTLENYNAVGFNPPGYGLLAEEWDGVPYPSIEVIPAGRHGSKELRIGLPENIWRPRAEKWGRAIFIFNFIMFRRDHQ